jgi:TRAP-type C4-dicarboxylate transport system substrate-binding protein
MNTRSVENVAVVALLAVVAAACSGSGGDKAGGSAAQRKSLVLTLEQPDPTFAGNAFAAAVAKRSGGSIRIDVSSEVHRERVDFEGGVVEAVRAHRSDLAVVGARVWDTLGVTSFQPLLAPFLVDNLELERRVLESPLAPRMLADVERSGVVGVALLPGPLRMPFGFVRPLVTRDDYRGFRMGAYPGHLEAATLRSLGATIRNYLSLDGASREGAILNYWAITGGVGYHGKTFVTNVVFWPRPETVVMNRGAFQSLTPTQQTILRDAGRQAVSSRLAEVRHLEQDALASICERKLAALVTAPAAEVAALDGAVQPVYAKLERNARTRELLAEIRALRAAGPSGNDEPRSCPTRASAGASKLEGAWTSSATETALLASGATKAEAATYGGAGELELNAGRWVFRGDHTTVTGAYVVEDDVLRLTMHTCTANPCSPGAISEYDWSVYHDTLSLAPHPGAWRWLVVSQGRRVR